MGGKIFNPKRMGAMIGGKRKAKTDSLVSGFISNKYTIKKETLKLISGLAEEACNEHTMHTSVVKAYVREIERVLLIGLEEHVDATDNINDAVELIRRQMAEQLQPMRGQMWTTNTSTVIGAPPAFTTTATTNLHPDPIPDGGSGSNIQQMPSGWGGLLPQDIDE